MVLIDPNTLQKFLLIEGVDESLLNIETLETLINLKQDEIIGLTSIPIHPVPRKQIIKGFKADLLELDYYPVNEVTSLRIGDTCIHPKDYVLDKDAGLIYFHQSQYGLLSIDYIQQVSSNFVDIKVNPLIKDMILYHFKVDNPEYGTVSSIKEMDTQINYNTSDSLGSRIYTRLEALKNTYSSARVKWL